MSVLRTVVVCVLAGVAVGWASDASADGEHPAGQVGSRVLSAKETKTLLRQLPYRFKFRPVAIPEGAEAAVAGRAIGRHRTVLNFGIALGHGSEGVPVPRSGTLDIYGYRKGGFIFTGDSMVRGPNGRIEAGPQFKTPAQWDEVTRMEVLMTDKLCKAATGEPCPI